MTILKLLTSATVVTLVTFFEVWRGLHKFILSDDNERWDNFDVSDSRELINSINIKAVGIL